MIGRRDFLSKLFGAGLSLAAVQRLVPDAEVSEIQPEQKYLFHFKGRLSPANMSRIQKLLADVKVKGIICDASVDISKL